MISRTFHTAEFLVQNRFRYTLVATFRLLVATPMRPVQPTNRGSPAMTRTTVLTTTYSLQLSIYLIVYTNGGSKRGKTLPRFDNRIAMGPLGTSGAEAG